MTFPKTKKMPRQINRLLKEKPYLLSGILNVTPDSFYDGGRYLSFESALKHAFAITGEGADILDIGAESTRPGSLPLTVEEEWKRLEQLLFELDKNNFNLPISIDTQKSGIAERALDLGATIVNDVSSGRTDSRIFKVVKERGAFIVLMHMRETPKTMQNAPCYEDALKEVGSELESFARKAMSEGIDKEKIILDPGIGFGKRKEDNLALISGADKLAELGFPILMGISRKSLIGHITGALVGDRLPGTIALNVCAFLKGVRIFRVHDVKENKQALDCVLELRRKD